MRVYNDQNVRGSRGKCNNRWICLVIMAPLVLEVVISNFTKVINDIGTIIWGK